MATSFRDPAGRLLFVDGRVIRLINPSALQDFEDYLNSQTIRQLTDKGMVVRTEQLDESAILQLSEHQKFKAAFDRAEVGAVVEHERIFFQSFPYEWPPEMLWAAGVLTLDLAESLLPEGLCLKDATPYNILYRGPQPVFVDLLSVERRSPNDPIWLPSEQFQRTFLRPLLVNKHFDVGLDQTFLTHRDGLSPEEVYSLCGPLQKLSTSFLTLVSLPTLFSRPAISERPSIYQQQTTDNPDKARFILDRLLKGLRRKLESLRPGDERKSDWADYTERNSYSASYLPDKQRFVEQALEQEKPERVLDVGCNTGDFSSMAARAGASVVAIDTDPVVVGKLWRRAQAERLRILPLVVDLSRPSPGIGWRNAECASFLERARGSFDCVMMLAVIHHLLVSERIPLEEIMRLASELTRGLLLVEYVSPEDPMSTVLARGRDHLYAHLTRDYFEQVSRAYFEILRVAQLGRTERWIYLMRKRDG
ncbi:MAG TPA: class I SAM-dependent methyltransferase [Pyrinomonadaceae bacterium]|jgi:SAM-dependent methyltransferase